MTAKAAKKPGHDSPFIPTHDWDTFLVPAQLMDDIYSHIALLTAKGKCHPADAKHLLNKLKKFGKENRR